MLGERIEEAHRELAVVGDLPGRDLPGASAWHGERVLDVVRGDRAAKELEDRAGRVSHERAEDGSESASSRIGRASLVIEKV